MRNPGFLIALLPLVGGCNNWDALADAAVSGPAEAADASATTKCPAGQAMCGAQGVCFSLMSDPANCGRCGMKCQSGRCQNGACQSDCAAPGILCNGICVDPSSDPNCGACGINCGAMGGMCSGGKCMSVCGPGQMQCGAGCTDPTMDSMNCGMCGVVCPNGQTCMAAMCQPMGGGLGCRQIFAQCFRQCPDDPTTCANRCAMVGAAPSAKLLQMVVDCLRGVPCFGPGPCDTGVNMQSCQTCMMMALMVPGGQCNATWMACQNDMP